MKKSFREAGVQVRQSSQDRGVQVEEAVNKKPVEESGYGEGVKEGKKQHSLVQECQSDGKT